MNWYNFIFSDSRNHRLQRHVAFWLVWWLYFTISYFHYQQTGLQKVEFEKWDGAFITKILLLLSIHIISCYCFISFLLPRYLLKARYAAAITGTLFISVFILIANSYLHRVIFPQVNLLFNYKPVVFSQNLRWTIISSGLLSAPKVIVAATAIKLLKRWYFKQKEKEQLDKEKLIADLKLLKTQVNPEFLFGSLERLYAFSLQNTSKATILLLKLSDLLSYTLYESDNTFVPLEKEIKTIKDYLTIQKMRIGESLEMDISIKGVLGGKKIAPLLLLPFVENCFSHCENNETGNKWINLELRIEDEELTMKVIVGEPGISKPVNEPGLINARKRLEILYPGRHELKTITENEIMMTHLKIVLEEVKKDQNNSIKLNSGKLYAAS